MSYQGGTKIEREGILGIRNRTENWKTAATLAPLIVRNRQHILASKIIENAKEGNGLFKPQEVQIELFWKGFRDYCKGKKHTRLDRNFSDKMASFYNQILPSIRSRLLEHQDSVVKKYRLHFNESKNYKHASADLIDELYDNLANTEVDVVLETSGFLLIGEAKLEEKYGANSSFILPHQLLRQYVMASILARMISEDRGEPEVKIIPFIIGDGVSKYVQVRAMIKLGFLSEKNVLPWDFVTKLGVE